MIEVKGNMNIGIYNEKPVVLMSQDNTQNNTQVNIRPQVSSAPNTEEPRSDTSGKSRPIYFAGKRGQKINLYRVILALHECGFFSDGNGGKPRQEDVFNAFGSILGKDFSTYLKNISAAGKHNNDSDVSTKVFDELKEAYLEYEEKNNQ